MRWDGPDIGIDRGPFYGDTHFAKITQRSRQFWCVDSDNRWQGPYLQLHGGKTDPFILGSFKDGEPSGPWFGWFSLPKTRDNLAFKGMILAGKPEGEWSWYCEPGCMMRELVSGTYKEGGRPDGEWVWHGDQQRASVFYDTDLLHGGWHHSWGSESERGQYRRGKRHGVWQQHNGDDLVEEVDYNVQASPPAKTGRK